MKNVTHYEYSKPGHSFISCGRRFGSIELEKRKHERYIYQNILLKLLYKQKFQSNKYNIRHISEFLGQLYFVRSPSKEHNKFTILNIESWDTKNKYRNVIQMQPFTILNIFQTEDKRKAHILILSSNEQTSLSEYSDDK